MSAITIQPSFDINNIEEPKLEEPKFNSDNEDKSNKIYDILDNLTKEEEKITILCELGFANFIKLETKVVNILKEKGWIYFTEKVFEYIDNSASELSSFKWVNWGRSFSMDELLKIFVRYRSILTPNSGETYQTPEAQMRKNLFHSRPEMFLLILKNLAQEYGNKIIPPIVADKIFMLISYEAVENFLKTANYNPNFEEVGGKILKVLKQIKNGRQIIKVCPDAIREGVFSSEVILMKVFHGKSTGRLIYRLKTMLKV